MEKDMCSWNSVIPLWCMDIWDLAGLQQYFRIWETSPKIPLYKINFSIGKNLLISTGILKEVEIGWDKLRAIPTSHKHDLCCLALMLRISTTEDEEGKKEGEWQRVVIGTKVGHGLDLKVILEESWLANLTSLDLVIVKLANRGEAKFIVYFDRVSVLASQQGVVAQTMTHGHVPTPHNIMLAPLLKHFMSRNILSWTSCGWSYLGEEMCQQQVFCSDHKSLVVPWGPLRFSHGSLVHSTKTVLH